MGQEPVASSGNTPPFLAFIKDAASRDAARAVAIRNGWSEGSVHFGDVRQSIIYLQEQQVPEILLVEIPSANEAKELLDRLADVCTSNMRVIVAGTIDEFSFYNWLKSIGIEHYLLEPFTEEALHAAVKRPETKTGESSEEMPKEEGQLIACIGARGGVGTTTVVTNLAWIIAREYHKQTGLLDMDPYFGSAAMSFDIEPGHGLRDAMEKPGRIDALFLDRVMVPYDSNLSLLCAENEFHQQLASTADSITPLIREMRIKFDYILVDIPRVLSPLTRSLLGSADKVVVVCEPSLISLRDVMRLRDYLVKELHRPEPVVVANREGLASKSEVKRQDFDKHFGRPVDIHMPCMMEAFSASNTGEILVDTTKNTAGLQALHELAEKVLKEADIPEKEERPKGLLSRIFKGGD